jgi:hypothetical protein
MTTRDDLNERERRRRHLTARPTHQAAIDAALQADDAALTAILDALLPDELYRLANAASRLRRACEHVHNGALGEAVHHGRTRWDFNA